MARDSRTAGGDLSFIIIILVGAAAWAHRTQLVHAAYIAFCVTGCALLLAMFWVFFTRRRGGRFQDVDTMSGLSFEHYVAKLLRANGFHDVTLTETYDFGVDIIAEKDGVRWGIQTKCYAGMVKADAVRQVVTGLKLYGCDRAMVITNSAYSKTARQLAGANDCVLVDRTALGRLAQQGRIL